MKKELPQRSGFTLIELLVVISIIAVLAVIGAAIFSGVQSRARDSRRQADTVAIGKALEANKTVGSSGYVGTGLTFTTIQASWFAGGAVPAEPAGYTPQYSIVYSTTNGTAATKPVAWSAAVANPTAPACCAGNSVTVSTTVPTAGVIYSFQVCTLLENGTAPNIYCRPNLQ